MTQIAQVTSENGAPAPEVEAPAVDGELPVDKALPGTDCTEGFTLEQCASEAAWRAAEVAEAASVWTSYSFYTGLFGMLIAALAVFFAWRAYHAAKAANEISRDSAKRQDRAYVDFSSVTFTQDPLGGGGDPKCTARIELKNFGRTPADNLTMTLKYGFFDMATDEILGGVLAEQNLEKLGAIMPEDEWGRNETIKTSAQRYADICAGKIGLRFEVDAAYTDVFGTAHSLKSTFKNEPGSDTMVFIAGTRVNT